jgi:hypothetical protein
MAFSLVLPSGAPFLPSLRPATRPDAEEVEHIVVIAGPSGSGKHDARVCGGPPAQDDLR